MILPEEVRLESSLLGTDQYFGAKQPLNAYVGGIGREGGVLLLSVSVASKIFLN